MTKTTPIIGRGPFVYALVEGVPSAVPAQPSPEAIERAWHLQQLGALFAPVASAPPFHPGLAAQRALTDRGRAYADQLAEQLASGLVYDAFYELLVIDPSRALAILDGQGPLPGAFALLRRYREPGQLANHLRALSLLGTPAADIPRLATSTELLIAHGRAVSLWLRRELGADQALLAHALAELAHAAGLTGIYFEEQLRPGCDDTYLVRAFCRGKSYELVYQHATKWIEPEVVSAFINAIARDLGVDLVVIAISELGTVFAWVTLASMLDAANAGVFGWNAEAEWHPYVTFRFAGELAASALAKAARALGMEEPALIAALEGAACAGGRAHPMLPREIDLIATYDPPASMMILHAIDAAGQAFSFAREPVTEAAEDAVNLWLADRYLPHEITDAAR